MTREPVLRCPACESEMLVVERMRQDDQRRPLHIDLYRCPAEECGRKAVVMFEPAGGLAEDQRTFVEKEIARRGAFFPSDYTGSRRR